MKKILYIIVFICIATNCYADINTTKGNHQATGDSTQLLPADTIRVRSIDEIIESLSESKRDKYDYSIIGLPLVFNGFQKFREIDFKPESLNINKITVASIDSVGNIKVNNSNESSMSNVEWFDTPRRKREIDSDLAYRTMIENPEAISYLYWQLPPPPEILQSDTSKESLIIGDEITAIINPEDTEVVPIKIDKKHWLHTLNSGIQFSQAYLSPNWYQGGNNSLTLLVNFLWNVKLNEVYHPKLLFENNVQYKLGLYSTPQDEFHKYSVSEDIFQWNLKTGVKAFKKWFYSFTLQFKTQLLNTYPQNSQTRTSSFMSPGDLNLGLGMTYSTSNKSKSLHFNASIAPISYNLKTCFDTAVDPTQFNITKGKKTMSEIGSNAELTFDWNITSNISYKSRLFLFSNYKYFLGDWENTFAFNINKFLSTQIYVHLRYDSSSEISNNWNHWMLKEILSFGFSYTFSTKI